MVETVVDFVDGEASEGPIGEGFSVFGLDYVWRFEQHTGLAWTL